MQVSVIILYNCGHGDHDDNNMVMWMMNCDADDGDKANHSDDDGDILEYVKTLLPVGRLLLLSSVLMIIRNFHCPHFTEKETKAYDLNLPRSHSWLVVYFCTQK